MENGNIGNQEIPESVIIIRFSAPGSVFFDMEIQGNVFPGQMVLVGDYLLESGREMIRVAQRMQREQIQHREEEQKIVVPKPTLVRK